MRHLGDITKINGARIEPVDCISFGSPCQDLSVAGLRKGLSGERSGLFMEAVRVIKEMRKADEDRRMETCGSTDEHIRPRFALWENVPGAFSSNKGEDFKVVLEELIHIKEPNFTVPRCKDNKWSKGGVVIGDDWSIAWRTLDAQYWGVPQRRKRIALVMDFAGRCAGEILFERESMSGDSLESIPTWKNIAKDPKECIGKCNTDESYTLKIRGGAETYIDQRDGKTKGAGKGALIQNNLSGTIGASQDQTLFR